MRVLVSGGGTAGHVYPSLTVAEHLRDEEQCDVVYVGTPGGLEATLASDAGVPFHAVPAKGFDRARPFTFVSAGLTAVASWVRCIFLLRKLRPSVVIGFGGYVSLPLGLAAAAAGVPLILHEQNAVPGLANRVLSRWARVVCVTYAEAGPWLRHPERALVTGNPVRPRIASASAAQGRQSLGLAKGDVVLLVFGGSRGARHLNSASLDLYSKLMDVAKLQVVHIAGPLEVDTVRDKLKEVSGGDAPRWQVHDYIEGIGDAIAAADLVVCRAGATTLAELTIIGRPAVLVPFPYATDDHQTRNAEALAFAGAATIVADGELDTPAFGEEVLRLLGKTRVRKAMGTAAAAAARPLAAHAIAEAAMEEAASYSGGRVDVSEVAE